MYWRDTARNELEREANHYSDREPLQIPSDVSYVAGLAVFFWSLQYVVMSLNWHSIRHTSSFNQIFFQTFYLLDLNLVKIEFSFYDMNLYENKMQKYVFVCVGSGKRELESKKCLIPFETWSKSRNSSANSLSLVVDFSMIAIKRHLLIPRFHNVKIIRH